MILGIRPATPQDVDWLMSRLERLSLFGLTKKKLFDDSDYTRAGLLNLIDRHVVFLAERDGQVVGFIGGYFVLHPFNPTVKMLSELFWWVDEEHRGCGAGAKLALAFVDHGKAHADWTVFGLSSNTPVKEASILKMGFHLHERCYLMENK